VAGLSARRFSQTLGNWRNQAFTLIDGFRVLSRFITRYRALTFVSTPWSNIRRRIPMQGAISRLACSGAVMLLFESFPALIATEKEKTLLRVCESIFSFGRTQDRVLEVDPNGRISLTVKYGDIFSRSSEKRNLKRCSALRSCRPCATLWQVELSKACRVLTSTVP
jgi:hypothetical protein